MSEKRRHSTRNRGEPPLKKRPQTPPSAPPPKPAVVEMPIRKGLPFKIQDSQLLPTLSEPQDQFISASEYQSIAESGVLAASIEQSRRKWITEGVFERYWAKPSKKRTQDAQNPTKESMSRLGLCSMVIEPHVFEVTLYAVREPQPIYNPPVPQTSARPPAPYVPPIPNTSNGTSSVYSHAHPTPNTPQLTLPPFREGFAKYDPHGPPPNYQHSYSTPAQQSPATSQNTGVSPAGAGGAQSQSPKPSPDPVIQMLATKAASDHGLKTLMKVVASGRATQVQLREFQNHIDDLNAEIKAGRGLPPLSPRDSPFDGSSSFNSTAPAVAGTHTTAPSSIRPINSSTPFHQPTPIKIENPSTYYHQYHQPVKPKNAVQYKSEASAVVFDFCGTGDRFSFPRFSILEYLPGGNQVIVSFLIIRKGNSSIPGSYRENMSYYQPVTMRLSTPQPRTLEPLAKVVAPAEEVRRYMDSVFDKMSPMQNSYLAIRLPRAMEEGIRTAKDQPTPTEEPLTKASYSAPSLIIPMVA